MIASERTRYIISRLQEKEIVTFKQMAQDLNVSESTVRRDFEKLAEEENVRIVPGGAVLKRPDVMYSSAALLNSERVSNYDAKIKVAVKAAELIKDGDCVFIDGGDNLACLAPVLSNRNIRIVTNSGLFVLNLNVQPSELIILGGNYYIDSGFSAGNLYLQALKKFHFDRVFVGCSGVNLDSNTAYSRSYDAMAVKSIAMENGDHSYLLFDSEKLNKKGFCKFLNLDCFDNCICNSCPELEEGLPNLITV